MRKCTRVSYNWYLFRFRVLIIFHFIKIGLITFEIGETKNSKKSS